jgi:hypothetical protein
MREAKFYFSFSDKAEIVVPKTLDAEFKEPTRGQWRLTRWMPRVRKIEVHAEGEKAEITMADLTADFQKPCVLDIKMGTSYVNPDDPMTRKRRMVQKALNCSAATLGLRLTAGRASDGWELKKKDATRMKQERQIVQVLRRFVSYHGNQEEAHKQIEEALQSLLEDFRENTGVWFVSSSLLFILDAADSRAPIRIHMIDFAHVHPLDGGQDEGYMVGLQNLIRLWRRAAEGTGDEDDQ